MTAPAPPSTLITLIDRVGRAGRLGRELAVRFDVARSISLAHAWRRFRTDAKSAPRSQAPGDLEPAYRSIWLDAAKAVGKIRVHADLERAGELGERGVCQR